MKRILPLCSAILATFVPLGSQAAEPIPPEMLHPPEKVTIEQMKSLPAHPRLMADEARWAEMRQQVKAGGRQGELYALLRRSADELLKEPPVIYEPKYAGGNILAIIREAEHRILTLAAMYRLSGEKPYLEGARTVMHGLAETPWAPEHFLDPATACLSLSIGYDWLFSDLTPDEREKFAAKIKSAGLELTTHDQEQLSFLWADFNWNQICNTGLTFGALAIGDKDPELARYIINRTLAMLPRSAAAYAPDGLYPEGPGYWAYGTSYHVMLIEAFRSSFKTSYDLEKFPGFSVSASVIDQLTGPSGKFFNYFDTRPGRANQNLVFWFARETRRPDLASAEWARVRKSAETGDKSYGRGLVFALLWSPTTETTDQPTTGPLLWQGGGHQPVAVFRTAWNDPAATWLAIKGGTANYSHGHMDAGTFVIEANGVRWAIDPEIEDYLDARNRTGLTHAQFFSYAQDSARWAHFRLGPDGHNILRFNHARQNVDGQATIGPMRKSSEGASVEINLDTTYAGQAASVRRVASLRSDGTVMIDDTWTDLADHPSEVTWQWLTAAQASLEPGGVCLKQDGQTLHLRVIGAEPNRIELQDVAPLLDAKFDAPLPGYTRIVIRVTSPTGARGSLRVIAGSALPPTETPPSR